MKLNRKEASATGLLDPTPRKPYWDTIWSCKFCHEKSQDSQHYNSTMSRDRKFKKSGREQDPNDYNFCYI